MKHRQAVRWTLPVALIVVEFVIALAGTWVYVVARSRVLDPASVASEATLVVFGSRVSNGEPGDYVRGRLDTAVELYRDGKVWRIINSGNGTADEGSETAVMRNYLERRGVPASVIVDDPTGFDTAETCRHLRDTFRVAHPVLITQDFHVSRAIALCRNMGIDAVGVSARCECSWPSLVRNHLRETVLARPRALLTAITGR